MKNLFLILILINSLSSLTPRDCLCHKQYFNSQKSNIYNHETNFSTKINSFAIFDAFIIHLASFAYHPLINFKINTANLNDFSVNMNLEEKTGIFIKNSHVFTLNLEIETRTFDFTFIIEKMYWSEGPFFVLDLIDNENQEWKEQTVLKELILEKNIQYICHLATSLISNLLQKVHADWPISKLYLNPGVDDSNFSNDDCLDWSHGQSELEHFKIKIFHSSYRLMDKDSPSYHNKKEAEKKPLISALPEYLNDPMNFNFINDFGFNYIITRLLEISADIGETAPNPVSKISYLFGSGSEFHQKLSKIIGADTHNEDLKLSCANNNSLYMNANVEGEELFDWDLILDYGNKNLLSDQLTTDYESMAEEMIQKRENIYFLILVIEALVDLNFDFSITQNKSKFYFDFSVIFLTKFRFRF